VAVRSHRRASGPASPLRALAERFAGRSAEQIDHGEAIDLSAMAEDMLRSTLPPARSGGVRRRTPISHHHDPPDRPLRGWFEPVDGYARLHAVDQIGAGQRRLRAGCLWPQRLTPVPGWLGDRLFVVDRGRITAPATVPATDGSGTER